MALDVMDRDAKKTRGSKPFVFTNLKTGRGLDTIINHIEIEGHLCASLAMTVFLPANTATAHDGHGAAAGHLHWLDYGPAVGFILVAAACIARRKFLPR